MVRLSTSVSTACGTRHSQGGSHFRACSRRLASSSRHIRRFRFYPFPTTSLDHQIEVDRPAIRIAIIRAATKIGDKGRSR